MFKENDTDFDCKSSLLFPYSYFQTFKNKVSAFFNKGTIHIFMEVIKDASFIDQKDCFSLFLNFILQNTEYFKIFSLSCKKVVLYYSASFLG